MGGFLSAFFFHWDFFAQGFGTNFYINSVNENNGFISFKTYITKLITSALTLGSYGSGGYEGPMVMIGGSIGSTIARIPNLKQHLTKDDIRILTISGAAGALGAIFRSPLGGGIFVVEILYRSSLNYPELFPSILSSTMGYIIYTKLGTGKPLFDIKEYLPNLTNVPWFIITAMLAALAAILFMKIFDSFRTFFDKNELRIFNINFNAAIGGLFTGLILVILPQVGGTSINCIQNMINGNLNVSLLLVLFIAKILATALTVGSGGSGGVVVPALFIGSIVGNLMASTISLFVDIKPVLITSLSISGMAASFASIANVPVAASVMLVEMTGLQLGVPATLGSVIGYAVFRRKIIYNTTDPHLGEFVEGKKFRKKDRYHEH
ncbi:MAG: chloride channel protein [Bacillota bacterium]